MSKMIPRELLAKGIDILDKPAQYFVETGRGSLFFNTSQPGSRRKDHAGQNRVVHSVQILRQRDAAGGCSICGYSGQFITILQHGLSTSGDEATSQTGDIHRRFVHSSRFERGPRCQRRLERSLRACHSFAIAKNFVAQITSQGSYHGRSAERYQFFDGASFNPSAKPSTLGWQAQQSRWWPRRGWRRGWRCRGREQC